MILDCSSGEAAVEMRKRSRNESVVFHQLDLLLLASVREFSAKILEDEPRINILIDDTEMMMCSYAKTVDVFEMQFIKNHLKELFMFHQ